MRAGSAVGHVHGLPHPIGGRRLAALSWRVVLGLGAAILLAVITIVHVRQTGGFLFDFNGDLYRAGQAILHGRDPYRPGDLAALAGIVRAGGTVSSTFALPVYPAPSLLAAVPFALLPYTVSGGLFLILMIGAMISGLRLLGVRDWRCIALALTSWPFVFGLDVGALGPALVFGMGAAWRFRARLWPPAIAIASVVVAKLFPWTLLAWLFLTRRFRALTLVLAIIILGTFGAWAVIGFAGLSQYPRMLANLSLIERGAGVSVVSALLGSGVPGWAAQILALSAAGLLLGLAAHCARRPAGDAQAFGLALIAALVASPIVWPHYYVLLFVPIALVSPGLCAIWFAPLLTALFATPNPHRPVQMLVWILLPVVIAVYVSRGQRARHPG